MCVGVTVAVAADEGVWRIIFIRALSRAACAAVELEGEAVLLHTDWFWLRKHRPRASHVWNEFVLSFGRVLYNVL